MMLKRIVQKKVCINKVVLGITIGGMADGKNPDNHYLIINMDDPYVEELNLLSKNIKVKKLIYMNALCENNGNY
ncbi:hypothetical protein ABW02_20585 [Niallia circulans]|uniref:Uncharacterized protein n=1 Tax=Niallia circulans TaxID=1397 RepID=A0A0J1IA90_NIACI|nr:hypothetical protein ABW02_20585 [Niallia circulans]